MPKFKVYIEETATYEVVVEAGDEEEAAVKAEDRFTNEGCVNFPCSTDYREISNVEPLDD